MVVLFGVYPIARSIAISFTSSYTALTNAPQYIGFENYAAIFGDKYFWDSVWITIRFTLISVPINIVLAFLIALALTGKSIGAGRTFF